MNLIRFTPLGSVSRLGDKGAPTWSLGVCVSVVLAGILDVEVEVENVQRAIISQLLACSSKFCSTKYLPLSLGIVSEGLAAFASLASQMNRKEAWAHMPSETHHGCRNHRVQCPERRKKWKD